MPASFTGVGHYTTLKMDLENGKLKLVESNRVSVLAGLRFYFLPLIRRAKSWIRVGIGITQRCLEWGYPCDGAHYASFSMRDSATV